MVLPDPNLPETGSGPDGEKTYALTPMQLGMIYESVMIGRPDINLEQLIIHMRDEPIDAKAMQAAWDDLTARHDILRSRFLWEGLEQLLQVVQPTVHARLDHLDWREMASDEQESSLRKWLRRDRLRGVELNQAPAWRVTWIRTGERQSVLIWTFHHAMLDGRSFTTLLRDVLDDYSALSKGQLPEKRVSAPQFMDHCRALKQLDPRSAQSHFADALKGFDAPNSVAIGPAPAGGEPQDPSLKGQHHATLSPAVAERISETAQKSGTSVATLVHAAWGIVLARTSGRSDAVFGVTRAGRHLVPDAKQIAGCLINTVPLRIHLTRDTRIETLLHAIRRDQIDVRPHEHTPLTDIAACSELPGGTPLFESAVMFERGSVDGQLRRLGGDWNNRRVEVLEQGALPLTLAVYGDDEMALMLEFDPARITDDVAGRLLDYTCRALTALAELPLDTPVSGVEILPEDERATLIAMGQPDQVARSDLSVAANWHRLVTKTPDAPALLSADDSTCLTVAELDAKANQLAAVLINHGVTTGDLVAICLPRSINFIASVLAVQKVGAAFLPIDPTYPADAIAHMLDDSETVHIISDTASAPVGRNAIDLNRVELPENPVVATPKDDPDRTAYVIYTSGSTGAPKGVLIPHRALSGHVAAAQHKYELTSRDRVLQFASLSFDVSIEEILPTLLCGAELILRDAEMSQSLSGFMESCARLKITVLNLPTAFWHALVEHLEQTGSGVPPSLRLVIVGGEAVGRQALDRWRGMFPTLRWLNGYGPTEAAITSTVFDPACSAPLQEGEDVPIGRPMGHALAYVLSPDGGLAPTGAPGELWLGGDAVATGYLNRPETTAERFRPDPILGGQARIYASGDIVRWRADGTLSFGGRADRQVKINGFRIELREIEKVLEVHEDVGLALVAVDRKGTTAARLVAWVTPARPNQTLDVDPVLTHVQACLPRHMVPAVVTVDAFPKTPGGKVDVAALPRPVCKTKTDGPADEGDATTRQIAGVMAEILQSGSIAADESFYDLGGHSLLAIRLIGRLEQEFGQRLSIADLHAGPTPRLISRTLAGPARDTGAEHVLPIQPDGSRPPIYGIHVLGTNEVFFRPLSARLGPDQPVFGLSVGPLTENAPVSVEETAALYFRNIQAHQPDGPLCLAAVSQGSFIAFELAQLLVKAGRDVKTLMLFDAAGPSGRVSYRGWRRIAVHLSLLREQGLGYLATPIRNRLGDLRNMIELARLRWTEKRGGNAMVNPTMGKFVAANTLAIAAYQPSPYPRRLTVFRARDSVFDSPEAIREGLGWADVAGAGIDLIEVDGGHLSMLEDPYVEGLAHELAAAIDRA